MNEPPSAELVRQLTELQLCRPTDFRRARGRVKRLSFDLPAFDSVWIDSLVQLRLLTPFQAKLLEQGHANGLRIGSFVIVDELGKTDRGSTYLATRLNRHDKLVVKRLKIDPRRMDSVFHQMQSVLEKSRGFAHPLVVLPTEILQVATNELVTVSRFVPGLPLNELLIRRGRFPSSVVFEIGRQLLEGLAALHARSLIHGDIRLSNVRLTDHGYAVLVDGAIRPAVHPEITIHDTLALEAYDGMAPELIGTGYPPSASTEIYAVGCLLWQLLTGRPPFTTADPLAKLAAHQTQQIDDVRTLAPDTPALLADTIRQMTSPSSIDRPRSYEEILKRWRRSNSVSRGRLKQFRRLFNGAVPHFAPSTMGESSSFPIWTIALFFLMAGSAALFYEKGLRHELLEIVQHVKTMTKNQAAPAVDKSEITEPINSPPATTKTSRSLRLPSPSAEGIILLTEKGPYDASTVEPFNGELTIRSRHPSHSVIEVGTHSLRLRARAVKLEGLSIRRHPDSETLSLVTVRSQSLVVSKCELVNSDDDDSSVEDPSSNGAAITWTPNQTGSSSNRIEIADTLFRGNGTSLLMDQAPPALTISNVLKTGGDAFLVLAPKAQPSQAVFDLDHATLRETGPLLRISGILAERTGAPPIRIEANDNIFKLADPNTGLIVVKTEHPRTDLDTAFEFKSSRSSESVVSPGTELVTVLDPLRNTFEAANVDEHFEGLVANEIQFTGTKLTEPRNSRAIVGGPRRVASAKATVAAPTPGIDVSRIPAFK